MASNSRVIKLVYIISNIDKSYVFEWTIDSIDRSRFDLCFILLNPGDSELGEYIKSKGIKLYQIPFSGKKDLIKSFWACCKIFRKEKAEVIHCHLLEAGLVGLLAGKILGIKKRVYTRHHSNLHHVYFPRGVYYDRLINFLATHIIAISNNVKKILVEKENVNENKIRLIYHGFDLEVIERRDSEKLALLNNKYNSQKRHPVIGVISRYIELKGIQFIIPAFKLLLKDYPNAYIILANARGDYASEIKKLLKEMPRGSFYEIEFEKDVFSLYHLFDVFVHAPIDSDSEAFGQTYIEALAAGIPSVFTLSGIAPEFIINKENALVVNYKSKEEIYQGMKSILDNKTLYQNLKANGMESVQEKFHIKKMSSLLEHVYTE